MVNNKIDFKEAIKKSYVTNPLLAILELSRYRKYRKELKRPQELYKPKISFLTITLG